MQRRQGVFVETDRPAVFTFLNPDIRADIRRGSGRGKTGGGKGIERSNEVECGFECAAVGLGQVFFYSREGLASVAVNAVEGVSDDMQGGGFGSTFAQSFYLQYQRFVQIGGGHACRVEFFQCGQGLFQHCFIQHPLQGRMVEDVFDAVGQVALLVKEIDKDVDTGGFLVGKRVFAHLRVQVLLEILLAGDVGQHIFAFVSADLTGRRGVMAELGIGKFIRVFAFEQGVVRQPVFDFAFKFDTRHLQYAQRLLQPLVELLGLFELYSE